MSDDYVLIRSMIEHAERVRKRMRDVSWEAFAADEYLHLIGERLLQNIGEAARLVSSQTRDRVPEVPWAIIVGMRHLLVHEYFRTDLKIIWETCGQPIEELLIALRPEFDRLKREREKE